MITGERSGQQSQLPLRVLHVLGPVKPSGMERMLVSASAHFRDAQIEGVVFGTEAGSTFAESLRLSGYTVVLGQAVASSGKTIGALRQIVLDHGVDVVHLHTEGNYLRTVAALRWALRGRNVPIVRTVHSTFLATGRWFASRWLQAKLADPFVAAIVAPSPDVAVVERRIGRKCEVVLNWVDDRFFEIARAPKSSNRKTLTALIVGNCSGIKRHELALSAVASAGVNLIHLGDESGAGPEEQKLLAKLDSSGHMLHRGVEPPDDALAKADIFLMPSRHEGMGVALAEAIAVGVPALVADVPGFRWAREEPGVTLLPSQGEAWNTALRHLASNGLGPTKPARTDLSARRGAFEYAQIYRRAARKV